MQTNHFSKKSPSELRNEINLFLGNSNQLKNPSRSCYLLFALGYTVLHFYLTKTTLLANGNWWIIWALSAFITANIGTFYFFTLHEALHGAIFKSSLANYVIAFIGGVPFLCTPEVWKRWHTHHHLHTAMYQDTDRLRTIHYDDFSSKKTVIAYHLQNWNLKNIISYFSVFHVIALQHFSEFFESCIVDCSLYKIDKMKAILEYIVIINLFLFPFFLFPVKLCILGIYLPILFSNLICSLYIISNHFDSDITPDGNYPLINSKSTYIRILIKFSHMQFGHHVEHHIYPNLTHDKLIKVTKYLREKYKDEFKEESLFSILKNIWTKDSLHRNPRYYEDWQRTKI